VLFVPPKVVKGASLDSFRSIFGPGLVTSKEIRIRVLSIESLAESKWEKSEMKVAKNID